MKRRLTALLFLGALGLAAPVGSQTAGIDPRLQQKLSGRLRDAIVAIVDSAKRAGLPTEKLIDKALEGAAKRESNPTISETQIVNVVSRLAQDLLRAHRALGPGFTSDEVEAAMFAIKAGVDIKQLERLRAARSGVRIATAINVLEKLATRVNPDTAANIIVGLVLTSASDEQLLALEADIERDIAAGTPAASALSVRGHELTQTIAAAGGANSGVPGSALPSGLGSTQPGSPAANTSVGGGGGAGNVTPGGSKPAPAGKKATPKKP